MALTSCRSEAVRSNDSAAILLLHIKIGVLKFCDTANPIIILRTYIYTIPSVNQRKLQLCALFQLPLKLYGDSRNLNSFITSLHL
jgi:hypothetical protein